LQCLDDDEPTFGARPYRRPSLSADVYSSLNKRAALLR
jgi:hypothetical protein